MDCNIKSLYLCVKSMERAIAFYENFFEKINSDLYKSL
jgi:predicted enzyme related to lactoylglutathione lyase